MKAIVIDGKSMISRQSAHQYLASKLGFPAYYGMNLDALHDCLGDISEPVTLIVYHKQELIAALDSYGETLLHVLCESAEENPNLEVLFDGE